MTEITKVLLFRGEPKELTSKNLTAEAEKNMRLSILLQLLSQFVAYEESKEYQPLFADFISVYKNSYTKHIMATLNDVETKEKEKIDKELKEFNVEDFIDKHLDKRFELAHLFGSTNNADLCVEMLQEHCNTKEDCWEYMQVFTKLKLSTLVKECLRKEKRLKK